ncbi:MAG: phosphodiester glycosidase family protein [Eubacteriales bacterium]|nr:phosphodiester glycosidase family protein [Eubacteriales bacterium]
MDQHVSQNKEHSKAKKKGPKLIRWIITDILLIGAGLVIFALFHHVLPQSTDFEPVVLSSITASDETSADDTTISNTKAAAITTTATTDSDTDISWSEKFADMFTTDVVVTDTSYTSEDLSITIECVEENGITYYVADIYVSNIESFLTAFAGGSYGSGVTDTTLDMANKNGAILAVSGDYYGVRSDGIVIRNGVLYRDTLYDDILLLNSDGSMETVSAEDFDIDAMIENGAYQGWSFGPMLLEDGLPIDNFSSSRLASENPRCAIGYYEPGHYCFVVVDGRQPGYSDGITLKGLSQIFYNLGCTVAYNMDGGKSAAMVFMGELVNKPAQGGREISDIVYITEVSL